MDTTTVFAQIRQYAGMAPKDFFGVEALVSLVPRIQGWNTCVIQIFPYQTDFSPIKIVGAVSRLGAAIFILPFFSSIGAGYHAILGTAHLVISFVARERQAEENLSNQDIRGHVAEGLYHLIVAVYNFVLGLPLFGMLAGVGFVLQPVYMQDLHNKFHNGWREQVEHQGARGLIEHKAISQQWADSLAQSMSRPESPPGLPPAASQGHSRWFSWPFL